MLSNSSVVSSPLEPKSDSAAQKFDNLSGNGQIEEVVVGNSKGFIGVLEVYIHQARDIHNICIYHKQDVYAKICLTDDLKTTVSTQTVNGGGKNPVFNENLRLNVRSIKSSLKCEVWMLSRVRNYLEDQLLGFALVPLADVVIENGKLAKEFTLSSSDLFHSPSGFVQLTIAYNGASPEVMEISTPHPSLVENGAAQDKETSDSVPGEFDKIEFPDPNIVNENEMMVTEYYGIPCASLDSGSSENVDNTKDENHLSSDIGVHMVESFAAKSDDAIVVSKIETPPSSVSTNGPPAVSVPTSSQSVCDTQGASKSLNQDVVSPLKVKAEDVGEADSGSSAVPISTFAQPTISVNIEPEQKVVQQDYVDMYMKSMQQFTEALAKMKLPLDIGDESGNSKEKVSDEKSQASKENGPSPRVFYGSRAFF